MNDSSVSPAALVRQLLSVLEQSALKEQAQVLRKRFEARAWMGLGPKDIAEVAMLVAQISSAPEPVDVVDDAWSPLENLAAWVDAVPKGRQLLALLEDLAQCDEGDAAAALLTRLFVEHLRYEPHAVDETTRLDSTTVLRRLRTLARHGDFVVSLVELSFPYPWPSTFQPIFRRHPYGLVVAIAPGWSSCQFVYRVTKDASSLVQRTRSLLGFLWGDEGQDNLALWVRRLDLLRPTGGEDGAAMLRRAEAALATSPVELSRQWSSLPLHPKDVVPGVPWKQLLVHERRAFLQETPPGAGRLSWGLERVLRESFPFGMARKQGLLRYRSYTLGDANNPRAAFERGRSWVRHLTLELELVAEDGEVLPLSLAATVPEVDEAGRFLIDGVWLRWVPRVLPEGLLVGGGAAGPLARVAEDGAEVEEADLPLLEDGDGSPVETSNPEGATSTPAGEEAGETSAPDRFAEASDSPVSFAGGSLRTLLEVAVYRKLYSLRLSVRAYEDEVKDLPRVLRAILRGLAGRDTLPLLVSKVFLKAFLEPERSRETPEGTLPILRQTSLLGSGHAPAWACPEMSASLPIGTWAPVSNARLTPCGELAVPWRDELGRERLCVSTLSLTQVNPRTGGQGGGPLEGWVSAELAPFATLPLGRPRKAVPFLVRGQPVPERVRMLHVQGPVLRARATVDAPLVSAPRQRELRVRIPAALADRELPLHRVLVSRGATVMPGDVWLEAPLELWAHAVQNKALSTQRLHRVPSCDLLAHVFTPEKDEDEEDGATAEETAAEIELEAAEEPPPLRPVLSEAAERWFVPPGVRGTVVEVREAVERVKTGALLAWRLTLVVALEVMGECRGQLLLPDGRVASLEGGLAREEAPYGEDGEPVHIVLEDPFIAATSCSEIWFDASSGELLETATAWKGPCWWIRDEAVVTGPDAQLRFRVRDAEGIPAAADAPALSAGERLWWAAASPGDAAAVTREVRSWTGGLPGFWLHLVEVLEAARVEPPLWRVSESWKDVPTERREIPFKLPQAKRLNRWSTTYEKAEYDAPLRWGCECGRLQGRERAFELCPCGTRVLLRLALRKRRPLPVFRLCEPVLHPWRKETAAGLLGLTVSELERRCMKEGVRALGLLIHQAARQEDPATAVRERLVRTFSAADREPLLRALCAVKRDVAAMGGALAGRLLVSEVPILPAGLHPTGLPRGAPELVKSPLTRAYLRVRLASDRLRDVRGSHSRILLETARRALFDEMAALFGPVSQGRQEREPTHLAGLLARLWPLTRASELRSVVPGTFRIQGRLEKQASAPALEVNIERMPSPEQLAAHLPVPPMREGNEEDWKLLRSLRGSSRDGVVPVRLRVEREASGVSTTGVLTAGGPVYLPVLSPLNLELSSPDFWAERAARERLLRRHLPWLCLVMGAFKACEEAGEESGRGVLESTQYPGPSLQAVRHEVLELPASEALGTLALQELMEGLARPQSRPLEFCRLIEEPRPRPCVEDGARAAAALEPLLQRAFPGDGEWMRMSRRLLMRALVGWWKGPPDEQFPSGWRWLPPLERGPPGTRRYVPPLASVAWAHWPDMAAALAPVRFLLENEGRSLDGLWSHTLRLVLGFEVEEVPSSRAPSEVLPLVEEVQTPSPGDVVLGVSPPEVNPVLPAVVEAVGGFAGAPDGLSFLTTSREAWLQATAASLLVTTPESLASSESLAIEPKPEVVLLSSSMSNWLKKGSKR